MAASATDLAAQRAAENFPVASWLIAADKRPIVYAYYEFARGADDIADDPALDGAEKTRRLTELDKVLAGADANGESGAAVDAARHVRDLFAQRNLIIDHARHLLQAFRADAANRPTRGWSDLLAYCRFSAAPVGRFLLDLHGEARTTWPVADALCSALQILNHIQDCGRDWRALQRCYLPKEWLDQAAVAQDELMAAATTPALRTVFDKTLDGVERLLQAAGSLPAQIVDRRLRREAVTILLVARRLAQRLRRADPLARRVALSGVEKLFALAYGYVRGTWR